MKEREKKLVQDIQLWNSLKVQDSIKKKIGTAMIVITQENAIKKNFGKRFPTTLDFEFSKHPVYPYRIKEDLIVRLELNSSEKVILCRGDIAGICKLSCISPEYDAMLEEQYVTAVEEFYARTMSILYTKVKSILYLTL